jgi:hypothetical protein
MWLNNLRSYQSEWQGMLVITLLLRVIFIIFFHWYFLGCGMFSRYWNHSFGAPAWLWERSDKNLVLQQETSPQEHCPYDVQRCSLVYRELIIWKCPKHGISLWTNVSRGKINTTICQKLLSVVLYDVTLRTEKNLFLGTVYFAEVVADWNFCES